MIKFLKFENPDCAPCKVLEPVLAELKDKYNINIEHINTYTDVGAELAQKYHVMTTPTVIVCKDGKVHHQVIGLVTAGYYEELIKNLR